MTDEVMPSSPTRAPTSTRRAVLNTIRGSAGNLVEWYDVYVYTVFASYFEAQFFDKNDTNSTVYIYAIFAVTFIMRPVGSWFFGRYADRPTDPLVLRQITDEIMFELKELGGQEYVNQYAKRKGTETGAEALAVFLIGKHLAGHVSG